MRISALSTFEINCLEGKSTFGDPFQDSGVAVHSGLVSSIKISLAQEDGGQAAGGGSQDEAGGVEDASAAAWGSKHTAVPAPCVASQQLRLLDFRPGPAAPAAQVAAVQGAVLALVVRQ